MQALCPIENLEKPTENLEKSTSSAAYLAIWRYSGDQLHAIDSARYRYSTFLLATCA
ncbi:MAG: hypothetical protein HYZ45_03640 [Burkholderiales bacterium]|nr:hypothetical protein [Burkholderiales bacterium]